MLAAVAVVGCGPAGPKSFSAEELAAPMLVPPLAQPDLVLRTTEGVTFDLKREAEGYVTPLFFGLTGDSASVVYAFTQLRLGHPMAPIPVSADSGQYTVNHTVVVLAFTTDNLAHVAYPSGIRADDWAKDLAILAGST